MKIISSFLLLSLFAGGVALSSGCSSTANRQSTGEYIDDAAITTRVKAAFITDNTVKAHEINVDTYNGVVQLSGFVGDVAQKIRAEEIARGTGGVLDVTNNIQLKVPSNR